MQQSSLAPGFYLCPDPVQAAVTPSRGFAVGRCKSYGLLGFVLVILELKRLEGSARN